jgi:hypothetical protein
MKFTLTLFLCFVFSLTSGQELPDLTKYKHDIGFNTTMLLNGILYSATSPFDIMYKRQKSSNTALRVGGSVYVNTNLTTWSVTPNYEKRQNYSGSLTLGKEKQNQLSKKWIFNYGADMGIFYEQSNQEAYYNSVLAYRSVNLTAGGIAAPFLGIRFHIHEKLYLSTEASLRISYGRELTQWETFNTDGSLATERKEGFNNLTLQVQPAAGIFVFYRF